MLTETKFILYSIRKLRQINKIKLLAWDYSTMLKQPLMDQL